MIRNPQIQFASADAIAAFQEERLREEVVYLYENSPYYRRMFDGCGMQPGDIRTADDLRHLPVTTKTDLQLHPGEFVCVPRNRIIDYVTTSGTLGDPVTFALTEEDLGRLAYNYGYQRFQPDVMIFLVVLIIVIVQIIQFAGDRISKAVDHR